ncbi:MAG: hypothetical protein ACPF8V_07460 [Luteibaculum sp.]
MAATYKSKLSAGFKAKWNIYLFQCALENTEPAVLGFAELKLVEDSPLIRDYTTKYFQYEYDDKWDDDRSVRDIMNAIDQLEKSFPKVKEDCMANYEPITQEAFDEIVHPENPHCGYCGVTQKQIDKLIEQGLIRNKAETRGFSLEIDRLNPNEEYTAKNITLACYWCNNAKTDEFTVAEFEPIADGIRKVWNQRLKEVDPQLSIDKEFKYISRK